MELNKEKSKINNIRNIIDVESVEEMTSFRILGSNPFKKMSAVTQEF